MQPYGPPPPYAIQDEESSRIVIRDAQGELVATVPYGPEHQRQIERDLALEQAQILVYALEAWMGVASSPDR